MLPDLAALRRHAYPRRFLQHVPERQVGGHRHSPRSCTRFKIKPAFRHVHIQARLLHRNLYQEITVHMKVDGSVAFLYSTVFRHAHRQFHRTRRAGGRTDLNPRISSRSRPSQVAIQRYRFRARRIAESQTAFRQGIFRRFLADFQIIGINSRRRTLPLLPVSVEIDIAHAHVLGGVRLHGKRDLVARSRNLKPIDIGAQVELGRVRLHRKGLRRSGCGNPQRDLA